MNLADINKMIIKLNPYTQQSELRYYTGLRRKIERQNQLDIQTGNIPEMLKVQA